MSYKPDFPGAPEARKRDAYQQLRDKLRELAQLDPKISRVEVTVRYSKRVWNATKKEWERISRPPLVAKGTVEDIVKRLQNSKDDMRRKPEESLEMGSIFVPASNETFVFRRVESPKP